MQTEGFMVTFKNCLNFKKRIYFNFWGSNLIMKMKKIISLCIFFTVISTAFAEKKSFDVILPSRFVEQKKYVNEIFHGANYRRT